MDNKGNIYKEVGPALENIETKEVLHKDKVKLENYLQLTEEMAGELTKLNRKERRKWFKLNKGKVKNEQ